MYRVTRDVQSLEELRKRFAVLNDALSDKNVYARILAEVSCLNEAYGKDRDIEADLGGYVVVLWGTENEIERNFKAILEHHNLNPDEYEYSDKMILSERSDIAVTFRLFLCSSDYGVEIVTVEGACE